MVYIKIIYIYIYKYAFYIYGYMKVSIGCMFDITIVCNRHRISTGGLAGSHM